MEVVPALGKAQCQLTELHRDCGTPRLPQGFVAHSQHPPLSPGEGASTGSWLPSYHASKSDHSWVPHSKLKVYHPACLSSAQEKGCIDEIISKSCFCWRAENLETDNLGKSSIKVKVCPLPTNKSVFSALPKDAKPCK